MTAQALEQLANDLTAFQMLEQYVQEYFERFVAQLSQGQGHPDPQIRVSSLCVIWMQLAEDKTQIKFSFFDEYFALKYQAYPRQRKTAIQTFHLKYDANGALKEEVLAPSVSLIMDEHKNIIIAGTGMAMTNPQYYFADYVALLNNYYHSELRKAKSGN